jgi:hypothetical protein
MTSLEIEDGTVQIDAAIIAEAFGIAPEHLMDLMRQGEVTSLSERGIDEDAGSHRLTFYCGNRRLRIVANESGDVLQRSVIDFGDLTLPASARRPGG